MLGAAKNGPESGQAELRFIARVSFLSLSFFFRPLTCPVTSRLPACILFLDRLSPGLGSRYLYIFLYRLAVSPSIAITCLMHASPPHVHLLFFPFFL